MKQYVDQLVHFPSLQHPDFAHDFFQMSLGQIGDSWRRFHIDQQCYPFKMFRLAAPDLSNPQDCLREYRLLQEELLSPGRCPSCVDVEFSGVLLQYISPTEDEHVANRKILSVRRFLKDLSHFCPISSDVVECLHGACQSRLHRFRGSKPTDPIAKSICVLDKLTSAYAKFRTYMWQQLGDKRALNRLHAYHQHKGNQYTSWTPELLAQTKSGQRLTFQDLDDMLADEADGHGSAASHTPRKLSGFSPALLVWSHDSLNHETVPCKTVRYHHTNSLQQHS